MIVEVDGQEFDTDKIVIRTNGKVVEVTEESHCLRTLVYEEGTSASDGDESQIDTFI
jgi:hypothetical protein